MNTTRGRQPFTLVELLVVIAILSVLAAMLLPTLGNAKRTAMLSVCTSNVKQMMAATSMYSGENDGHIMASYSSHHSGTVFYWDRRPTDEVAQDWGGSPAYYKGLGLLVRDGMYSPPETDAGKPMADRDPALLCPLAEWFTPATPSHWNMSFSGNVKSCRYMRVTYWYRGASNKAGARGNNPILNPRISAIPGRAAVWDRGYRSFPGEAPAANHREGSYTVGYYDGSVRRIDDIGWAKTANSTYYSQYLGDWLDAQY